MYAFGATLSFTVAHASIVALRYRFPAEEVAYRARPNLSFRGVDWPLFAILGGIGTLIAWVVIVVQEPTTRWAGIGWLVAGFVAYAVYRRRFVREPMSRTVRAPQIVLGPGLEIEYRTILVPVSRTVESEEALVAAARLAAERGATIAVLRVIEVPLELPLDADLPDEEDEARRAPRRGPRAGRELRRARGPAPRARAAGRPGDRGGGGATRRRARRRGSASPAASAGGARSSAGPSTTSSRASPSRVLVTAGKRAA